MFSFVVKLVLAAVFPVFGDEAYYYIWSLHPQLSYFDHPGVVSWLIWLGHNLVPAGTSLGLRSGFLLLSFFIPFIWIKILKLKEFSENQILGFLILLMLNPLLGAGSVLATPDTPLVFFWSLSYLCFLQLLETQKIRWYSFLGICLGLGFCAKYHIVLFVLSGLLYLILSKKYRLLKWHGVMFTVLLGALFCLPVFIWNAHHEWSSFLFQIQHGLGESGFEWSWPAGYVIAQLLIINPFILFVLFNNRNKNSDRVFSLSQLGFFLFSSFKGVVEGNWPLTSHLHSTANFEATKNPHFKKAIIYWAGFYVLMIAFFISPYSAAVKKNLINSSQLTDLYPLVEQYKPLYGASYQVAALLSWKTQQNVPKLGELSRIDFYDSLVESIPISDSFYALKYDYSEWPAKYKAYKKTRLQVFDNTGIELYQFTYE